MVKDDRTYFRNVAEGKNTIAFNLSVPVEYELVIPSVQPSKIDQPFWWPFDNVPSVAWRVEEI